MPSALLAEVVTAVVWSPGRAPPLCQACCTRGAETEPGRAELALTGGLCWRIARGLLQTERWFSLLFCLLRKWEGKIHIQYCWMEEMLLQVLFLWLCMYLGFPVGGNVCSALCFVRG